MTVAAVRDVKHAGGRPTREEAARREERLIDVATTMFLDNGFDGTSMDAIAAASGTGKPSLYARYGDKRALFLAVLRHNVALWASELAQLGPCPKHALSLEELEPQLVAVARHILERSIKPECVALKRVLTSQAGQFPDLAATLQDAGWGAIVRHVATLLRLAVDFERSPVHDPELAADLFLSLVLGRLSHEALIGIEVDRSAIGGRIAAAVKIFLGLGFVAR
jgi:TetR/AcrR family transcriptional regulator, mexJK operon transcriptional repressor